MSLVLPCVHAVLRIVQPNKQVQSNIVQDSQPKRSHKSQKKACSKVFAALEACALSTKLGQMDFLPEPSASNPLQPANAPLVVTDPRSGRQAGEADQADQADQAGQQAFPSLDGQQEHDCECDVELLRLSRLSADDFLLILGARKSGRTSFARMLVCFLVANGLSEQKHSQSGMSTKLLRVKSACGAETAHSTNALEPPIERLLKWWRIRKVTKPESRKHSPAVVLLDDIESLAKTSEQHEALLDLAQHHAEFNVLVIAISSHNCVKAYNLKPTFIGWMKEGLRVADTVQALALPSTAQLCAAVDACNAYGVVWCKFDPETHQFGKAMFTDGVCKYQDGPWTRTF